ncbi:MAG: type II secretion system protein [Phycisphaerae bacterium]|nr:type II secretion system protein [Phycisphaerae bacterium]
MSGKNKRHEGFLLTEITVSMTILGILVAGLALSLHGFAKFNRYQLVRQQCIAAAQAELESMAATGGPIPDEDFARLWSNLSISIKKSPGTGQWLSMELVEVTAVGKSFRKEVKIQLSRYFPGGAPPAEGK